MENFKWPNFLHFGNHYSHSRILFTYNYCENYFYYLIKFFDKFQRSLFPFIKIICYDCSLILILVIFNLIFHFIIKIIQLIGFNYFSFSILNYLEFINNCVKNLIIIVNLPFINIVNSKVSIFDE